MYNYSFFPLTIVVDCGTPPFIDNGNFTTTETTFESVAEYGCNEGFTLSGNQNRICQADGTWSGADPECMLPQRPNSSTQIDNLGPIIGGAIAGFLVATLVTLGIILAAICTKRQKKTAANNQINAQAVLAHFQQTEPDNTPSRNVASVTSTDAIPAFHNEAYAITNATIITTSQNEAYGLLQPGGRTANRHVHYDYVINPLSHSEAGDQYDYVDS